MRSSQSTAAGRGEEFHSARRIQTCWLFELDFSIFERLSLRNPNRDWYHHDLDNVSAHTLPGVDATKSRYFTGHLMFQGRLGVKPDRWAIVGPCYNHSMTVKSDLIEYRSRWMRVEKIVHEDRRSASYELRWKQLNSAYAMAKGLGLLQPDKSERKVFQIWANLREKATNQKRKE